MHELLEVFLQSTQESMRFDPIATHKHLMTIEKAEDCLGKIIDIGEKNNYESRKMN